MAKKFLDGLRLTYLWGKIKENFISNEVFNTVIDSTNETLEELDSKKANIPQGFNTIEDYVEDYVYNNATGGGEGGALPSQLDIYCGNSLEVMD